MPGLDMKIDPITRDYVDDGEGGFATTRDASTAIVHQILTEKNHWVGDFEAGSRLYQLPHKLSDEVVRAARDIVEEAMRPLDQAGLITDSQLTTERDVRGKLVLSGTARDIQTGEIDLSPLLPGGA